MLLIADDKVFIEVSKEVEFFREKLHSEKNDIVNLISSVSMDRDSFSVESNNIK